MKPTDRQLYLWKDSCHPPNTKTTSLPYGLGLRIRRICEREDDYKKQCGALKTQLRRRGYSDAFIENQLQKVDKLEKSELAHSNESKETTGRVPLVFTYSNFLPNVHEIAYMHL